MKRSDVEQLYRNMGREVPADIATQKLEKYGRIKKEMDGHLFDSTSEALAYRVLRQWEQHGVISGLKLQPTFRLQDGFRNEQGKWHRPIDYRADFEFIDVGGGRMVVDVKGFETPVFRMKEKMFRAKYPGVGLELWTPKAVRELAKQ